MYEIVEIVKAKKLFYCNKDKIHSDNNKKYYACMWPVHVRIASISMIFQNALNNEIIINDELFG